MRVPNKCYNQHMVENKFNYFVGVMLVVLLVAVVYVGGEVGALKDDVANLADRVGTLEYVSLGFDANGGLGYEGLESVYAFDEEPYGDYVTDEYFYDQ